MLIIEGETAEQFHKRQREKYPEQYKIMDKILKDIKKKKKPKTPTTPRAEFSRR